MRRPREVARRLQGEKVKMRRAATVSGAYAGEVVDADGKPEKERS
jgi:hypothetical protein